MTEEKKDKIGKVTKFQPGVYQYTLRMFSLQGNSADMVWAGKQIETLINNAKKRKMIPNFESTVGKPVLIDEEKAIIEDAPKKIRVSRGVNTKKKPKGKRKYAIGD